MISFFSETSFEIENVKTVESWIERVVKLEELELGDLAFVFCDDAYLHKLNVQFLDHDTLTDILTFDYTVGKQINGEIYISEERVRDNADDFNVNFIDELHRVIIHGVLHLCGYKDKTSSEEVKMREMENKALKMR